MNDQPLEKDHVIIGTAGHIDHGKTALVKALTGKDADTLEEEKRRGITIELGFVFMDTPSPDKQIVFIDVPGHEKLVKTMVAGASNIDAAVLVIAADEGINVQTREHFDILKLLDIQKGIIALTKTDLVDDQHIQILKTDMKDYVKGSFLEDAPIIPVSSISGFGIEDLKASLYWIAQEVTPRVDRGTFRMPIDRVFTMRGFGTVTAGTVLSGTVKEGDKVEIFPEGLISRVRGVQVHHSKTNQSHIGKRTAINLSDIDKENLRRGQTAAAVGSLTPSNRFDGKLHLLKSYEKKLKNRERLRLHTGTSEIICRLVLLDRDKLSPGETAFVQFVLEAPNVAMPQDRFVVRTFSPLMTIGGGIILDSAPLKHKRFSSQTVEELGMLDGNLEDTIEQVFLKGAFLPQSAEEAAKKIGQEEKDIAEAVHNKLSAGKIIPIESTKAARKEIRYLHETPYANLKDKLRKILLHYFEKKPYESLAPISVLRSEFLNLSENNVFRNVLEELIADKILYEKDGKIGLTGHTVQMTSREQTTADKIEQIYKSAKFKTPIEEDVRTQVDLTPQDFKNILTGLLNQDRLVRLSGNVIYHKNTFIEVKNLIIETITKNQSITIAELRDRLQFSRKYAQAILEYFDASGLTKREEDKHIFA
ncbi:MAG: selenocysteine-specific translation elongation factor [Candidatus Aminicenantes bacterium]|nr:selenocysteine-specific translation elongation factor [Candidatus Aminicenantes bacterium]